MARMRWMAFLVLAACGGQEVSPRGAEAPIVPVAAPVNTKAEPDTPWVVTPRGIGPMQVGMRARDALGVTVDAAGNALTATCTYVRAGRLPAGVGVMANNGEVARVDVDSGRVATAEGARVGDSEARIRSLYVGRLSMEPHKYAQGRYLIVTPRAPADSTYRIVFETDGRVVTKYRAGRLPEVQWVERCG